MSSRLRRVKAVHNDHDSHLQRCNVSAEDIRVLHTRRLIVKTVPMWRQFLDDVQDTADDTKTHHEGFISILELSD